MNTDTGEMERKQIGMYNQTHANLYIARYIVGRTM